jgi:hypothetical protein
MIIISIEWIGGCIYFGRKKTLEKEKRCTEIVKAHINAAEDHYFFFAKYYTLSLSYQYNDKEYHVRKGWFRKELCEEDIDFEGLEIRILGKRRKERLIPVHAEIMERVKNYIDLKRENNITTNAFLVNNRFEPMSKKQLYSFVCKEVASLQATSKASPHTLRHSFATNTLAEGADLMAIKELMGHSTIASTQVYTHTTIEELKKAYKQAHPSAEIDE